VGLAARHAETRERRTADHADACALGGPACHLNADVRPRTQPGTQRDAGGQPDPLPRACARADSSLDAGPHPDADTRSDGDGDAHAHAGAAN